MSENKNFFNEDTYDILHENFSLLGDDNNSQQPEESDVKNSGEIYFSAASAQEKPSADSDFDFDRYLPSDRKKPVHIPDETPAKSAPRKAVPAAAPKKANAASGTVKKADAASGAAPKKAAASSAAAVKKNPAPKKAVPAKSNGKSGAKKSAPVSFLLAALIIVFVLVASAVIRIPVMGCVSDILAIDRDSTEIRVILDENTKTGDVISMLGKKKLIYSSLFCKAVSGFLGYSSDDIFPSGTYYLSPDMGLEGMLKEIMSAGATEETITLTFPEGFTVDQIISRLSQNGVASENALYKALDDDSLYEEFDFLSGITNKEARYRALEGYLYPDTYEFYIDENPVSVFKRFLNNFNEKWQENFAADFEGCEHTMDEIITVASILEKEAKDAEQMPLIASIIYNRLNSSSFPHINCDSTQKYIEAQQKRLETEGTYLTYLKVYNTYQQTGLPVGAICNPGSAAIASALSPDNTDYYYFLHDKSGKIYTARTESEHYANQQFMENEE